MVFVMMTMSKSSAERIMQVLDEEIDIKDPEEPVTEQELDSVSILGLRYRSLYLQLYEDSFLPEYSG